MSRPGGVVLLSAPLRRHNKPVQHCRDDRHHNRAQHSGPESIHHKGGRSPRGQPAGEQQHQGVDDNGKQAQRQAGDRQREHRYDRFDHHVDYAEDRADQDIGQDDRARTIAPALEPDARN